MGEVRLQSGSPDSGYVFTSIDSIGTAKWLPSSGGGSNWSVNGNDIYPQTATTLMVRPGSTSTNARLFDFRVPSNLATSPDTVGVISWSSTGTAAEKRRISLHNAAMEFEGPNPSYRINASGAGQTVGGAFVQERGNMLQHYIQSERDDRVRWNFAPTNPSKLIFAGWHDNFGVAIGSNLVVLDENDLLLKTFGEIGSQRKGVLFSAISEAERDAWTPTSAGTMIYNETEMCYNLWTGTVWKSMCATGGTWPPTQYADDAAAGAAGLLTGRWYQTSGAGAAPLNVAGILMVKQ